MVDSKRAVPNSDSTTEDSPSGEKKETEMMPQTIPQPKNKTQFDAKRFSGFHFDPNECVLIGLDEGDKSHPLYDPRVNLPINESLVKSILADGVLQPIRVKTDGDGRPVVVMGRQRVKAAREANKRLVAEGMEPRIKVPALSISKGTDDMELQGYGIAENAIRKDDNALVLADKCHEFLKFNGDSAEAREYLATCIGHGVKRIDELLTLRELDKETKDQIRKGNMGVEAALFLAKVPKEQRQQTIKLAAEKGEKITTKKARETLRKSKGKVNEIPTRKVMKEKLAEAKERRKSVRTETFEATLLWVMGKGPCPIDQEQ